TFGGSGGERFLRRLAPDVELLAVPGDEGPVLGENVVAAPDEVLGAVGSGLAHLVEELVGDPDDRAPVPPAGADEVDLARPVPDDVVLLADVAQGAEHPPRVAHREERAPEVGPDVVAAPWPQLHRHLELAEVRGDPLDADAAEEEGRPD